MIWQQEAEAEAAVSFMTQSWKWWPALLYSTGHTDWPGTVSEGPLQRYACGGGGCHWEKSWRFNYHSLPAEQWPVQFPRLTMEKHEQKGPDISQHHGNKKEKVKYRGEVVDMEDKYGTTKNGQQARILPRRFTMYKFWTLSDVILILQREGLKVTDCITVSSSLGAMLLHWGIMLPVTFETEHERLYLDEALLWLLVWRQNQL